MAGKRVTRTVDNSAAFIQRLSPLNGAEVKGGYFADQGLHESSRRSDTGERMSLVDLALLMHWGTEEFVPGEKGIPASRFLEWIPTAAYLEDPNVRTKMASKLKMVIQGRMKPKTFLDWIGKLAEEKADEMMGNPAYIDLFGTRGNDKETPLEDSGDLKKNFTTRVNMGGATKK
jgi:hypothetical protein